MNSENDSEAVAPCVLVSSTVSSEIIVKVYQRFQLEKLTGNNEARSANCAELGHTKQSTRFHTYTQSAKNRLINKTDLARSQVTSAWRLNQFEEDKLVLLRMR